MKITGGKFNSLSIKTADFTNIKPTLSKIRQAVFNTISSFGEYESFCDLFAGSGIMTFEAISRGYKVCSLEIDRRSSKIIAENAQKLKTQIELYNTDAIKFLNKTSQTFDIFYIDPPYNSDLYDKAIELIDKNSLLNPEGIIILEKPAEKEVFVGSFQIAKEKSYGDKTICYLKK